jgi:hypothetical protein
MIIARFGATWDTAYNFGAAKGSDDWAAERPAVVQRVGGSSGAFDFYQDKNYPVAPLVVKKTWDLYPTATITPVGGGIYGTGDLYGIGQVWGTGTSYNQSYADLDGALDALHLSTISRGRSKLWGLLRDGSRRWAWAKCTGLRTAENYQQKFHLNVETSFMCPEGLWYGEEEQTQMFANQTLPRTFTLTNSGTIPAPLHVGANKLITGSLTSLSLTNNTNGMSWSISGISVAHGNGPNIIIDSGSYTCDQYDHLTLPAGQQVFMQLEPGDNSLTYTASSSASAAEFRWFDTYL